MFHRVHFAGHYDSTKLKLKYRLTFWLALCAALGIGLMVASSPRANAAGANVSTQSAVVAVTPTISSGVAYTSGDAVGGKMVFSKATDQKRTALLASVVILDKAKQNSSLDLVCYSGDFTATADNAAYAVSDADNTKAVVAVSIPNTSYIDIGGSSLAIISGVSELFATTEDNSLRCQLIARGTPTYTSTSDIQVTLTFLQD